MKTGELVTLTEEEQEIAAYAGHMRRRNARDRGSTERTLQGPELGPKRDREAVMSELAFAKLMGFYPTSLSDKDAIDVAPFEVKVTVYTGGHLCDQTRDKIDPPYVLMIGEGGIYRCVGWAWGRKIKTREWWSEKFGSFKVPQSFLTPLEDESWRDK